MYASVSELHAEMRSGVAVSPCGLVGAPRPGGHVEKHRFSMCQSKTNGEYSMTTSSRRLARSVLSVAVAGVLAVTVMPGAAWANASKVQQPAIVSADPADFTPNVLDGKVNALVEVGDLIIAGGLFTEVQEPGSGKPVLTRSNIMAFNASTGAVAAGFTPTFNGEIKALTLSADGASVYAGGFFTTVNGQSRNRLARIQVSDGSLTPGFAAVSFNSKINDLSLRGDQLLVAGAFNYVGSSIRRTVASVNAATGALTDYLRAEVLTTRTGTAQTLKLDMSPDESTLFAIGNFTSIDGLPVRRWRSSTWARSGHGC